MPSRDPVEPRDKRIAAPPALRRVLGTPLLVLYGLGYAELAVRFPEAAAAAAYIREAFGSDRLSQLPGVAVAAVAIVSTVSIARGSVGYVQAFVLWPDSFIAGGVVALFTAIACLGVRESVGIAAMMTAVEIGGLLLVVSAGVPALPTRVGGLLPGSTPVAWIGMVTGAFLAFSPLASRTLPTWLRRRGLQSAACRARDSLQPWSQHAALRRD